MTRMTLNDTVMFPIGGYNRYTEVREGKVYSNANVNLVSADNYSALVALADETITSLKIDVDGSVIYNLTNQNGKITNINEYLNGDMMSLNMNISFTSDEGTAEEII